jgi:hypothetical protein
MVRPADWVSFWPFWLFCFCWAGFDVDMNTRMIARELAEEAPHNLSKRIARFALAINACSTQYLSSAYWRQAKGVLADKPHRDPNESGHRPVAGTLLPSH